MIRAEGIEATEFPGRAERHGVWQVPAIVVNDRPGWIGNVPEGVFVDRLLELVAP